jgi:hypothetical protein
MSYSVSLFNTREFSNKSILLFDKSFVQVTNFYMIILVFMNVNLLHIVHMHLKICGVSFRRL